MWSFEKLFKNKIFLVCFSIILIAGLVVGSFYFGYEKGTKNPQVEIIHGVANLEQGKPQAVDFSLFWDVWQIIKNQYVGASKVDNQNLVYGAITGLVNSLGDVNSVFMPPSDAQKFNQDISGQFSGIGAQIDVKDNQLVIVAPLKGTPAEKAGLRAADKIIKIDNQSTTGLTLDEAVKLIRGQRGTTVVLNILRDNWAAPKDISIVRDVIQVPTLDWKMLDGDIAYVQLYNFYENAPFLFYQMAVQIAIQNPKGIILDLRDNPGGYLDAAVNLAGWFLNQGDVIVKEEFGSGEQQIFKAQGPGLFKNMPMVILINEGSASASEILAGALRDDRQIKLIGKKSFGKGTVQELEILKDSSVVKITVAHWLMPAGQLIDKNGLTPDYVVEFTEQDAQQNKDPQLDKAIEVIKNEITSSPTQWNLNDYLPQIEVSTQ